MPASLNRGSTYGDIWGVWAFYLKHPWPTQEYLTGLGSAYVLELAPGTGVIDTASYSEEDLAEDLEKLREVKGGNVDEAVKRWEEKRDAWSEEVGDDVPFDEPHPLEGPPAERLYNVISHMTDVQGTNSVLRKLGYGILIDTAGVVTEGAYEPSVAAVFLDPTAMEIVDASGTGK